MVLLNPSFAILDETDSGLDVDALRVVAEGIKKLQDKNHSILIITHYNRILHHVIPDKVHVMKDGRLVETGDKELATRIEKDGYN